MLGNVGLVEAGLAIADDTLAALHDRFARLDDGWVQQG
jgi:hypothetical protein